MPAKTRHGSAGYGIRRTGSFLGKTAGTGGGGGGRPVFGVLTRHGGIGHGTRRAGNFSGKTAGGALPGTGGPRPAFGVLTRHGGSGYGKRRCGSFAGKTVGITIPGGAGGRPDLAAFTRLGPAGFGTGHGFDTVTPTLPGTLNATDLANIADAVWSRIIEAGLSAEMIQRILLAYAAGNISGGPDAPKFLSVDGSKVRISGTADPLGNRSRTILDGS